MPAFTLFGGPAFPTPVKSPKVCCPDCDGERFHTAGCALGGNGQPITEQDRAQWVAEALKRSQNLIIAQVIGNSI